MYGIAYVLSSDYASQQEAQCLNSADLDCDRFNGSPLRWMILAAFGDQAHGTFADFGGILYGFLHGSIFSRVGASTKSGAVQCDEGAPLFTVRVDGAVGPTSPQFE